MSHLIFPIYHRRFIFAGHDTGAAADVAAAQSGVATVAKAAAAAANTRRKTANTIAAAAAAAAAAVAAAAAAARLAIPSMATAPRSKMARPWLRRHRQPRARGRRPRTRQPVRHITGIQRPMRCHGTHPASVELRLSSVAVGVKYCSITPSELWLYVHTGCDEHSCDRIVDVNTLAHHDRRISKSNIRI